MSGFLLVCIRLLESCLSKVSIAFLQATGFRKVFIGCYEVV